MAYVKTSHDPIGHGEKLLFSLPEQSGGLIVSENSSAIPDNCQPALSDMIFSDGALVSRGGYTRMFHDKISGKFHGYFNDKYYGCFFFHTGKCLYRFDGKELFVVSDSLDDENTIFYRMNKLLCIISAGRHAYQVNEKFEFSEAEIYIPIITESEGFPSRDFTSLEPINMMTRRVRTKHIIPHSSNGANVFLPVKYDPNYNVYVKIDDGPKRKSTLLYNNELDIVGIYCNCDGNKETHEVEIEFTILGEDDKFEEYFSKIYNSTLAASFGGNAEKGTRIFLSGNPSYPGEYFRSELLKPFYFPDTNCEVLGEGSENVTGMMKRYDRLFMFTDNHIYAVDYVFSDETGASFPIDEINTSVGCNMPGSLALIDNTIVFGNTDGGIYILESTDIFNELNVRPLSGNIMPQNGTRIFADSEGRFCSCDFDRRYYIFNGERLYVWDYGRTPYYSSDNYHKAQLRLAWYSFPSMKDVCALMQFGGRMYFFTSGDETRFYCCDERPAYDTDVSDGKETTSEFMASFSTKEIDFGEKLTKKKLGELWFDCKFSPQSKKAYLEVTFFGDGEEYYSHKITEPVCGKYKIKLPPRLCDKYRVAFTSFGAHTEISSIVFGCKRIGRIKNYSR